ncbi:MAG TPA: potassium-transporting ATPase subunit KdpA [Caulobacteraceae bacterium]|nr:potassium-transporting ATPase subunit KdpA [Caulobacteraceae bacterium]
MRWLEYLVFLGIVVGLAKPTGLYLARVFEGRPTWLDPVLRPVETLILAILGVRRDREMSAPLYFLSFVLFSLLGTLALFALLMLQTALPGGPADKYLSTPTTPDLALNTAISFATTTTWQAYAGESTMRYLTQAVGLVSQNFLAGAAGLAVGIAFIRGLARTDSPTIGNFWVDLVRAILWVLLPIALVGGIVLMWQGVPMNFAPYTQAHTLEGPVQTIAQGPVAALELIKNLGTNGGGSFNVNGAHPYENPTPLVGFIALLAIAVLPASLTMTFGEMTGRPRAGWVLLGVMVALFVGGLAVCDQAEAARPPQLAAIHLVGGNMEGKETRFGVGDSVLTAVVTSNGATGSYDSMHDSFEPLGVMVPLVNMLLGEIIFGGLGTGIYGIVMIALVAVFLGGLMIGRTPAYLGKQVTASETKLIALYMLLTPLVVMSLSALALTSKDGLAAVVTNTGSHRLTEVIYAYASSMANNGQTMASLNANSPFYNVTTGVAMLAGRFGLAGLALALAGRFAAQGRLATTSGTLPTDTISFGALVLGTVVIVGALNFLPALALGPVVEALQR